MFIPGYNNLFEYMSKLNIQGEGENINHFASRPGIRWLDLVSELNRNISTNNAIDLIIKIFVYDYEWSLRAKEAMQHPYIHSIHQPSPANLELLCYRVNINLLTSLNIFFLLLNICIHY